MSEKKAVISMECIGGEIEGVVYSEHEDGPLRSDQVLRMIGDRVVSYLEEMQDTDMVQLEFVRKDMTLEEWKAVPEV